MNTFIYFKQFYFKQFSFACQKSQMVLSIDSTKHQSFVYTQLSDQTVLFQTIQFSICTQLKCQTVLFDPIRCYHSGPEWTWDWWHSPKLQYYWSVTIKLFCVIQRYLLGESYHFVVMQSVYSTVSADWAISN